MSLFKLPFLVASAVGIHVSCTPPNRPPSKDEMLVATFPETYMNLIAKTFIHWSKAVFWIAVLGEATTILIPLIPASKLPKQALRLLVALGGPDNRQITPGFLIGSTLISLAGILRWQCYRTLGRLFTFQLSVRKGHRLVTEGPYSVVRHPGYSAVAMYLVGAITMYSSRGSWLRVSGVLENPIVRCVTWWWFGLQALVTFTLFRRCPREDAMMRKEFGHEWEEWSKRVRYWLIPGIY